QQVPLQPADQGLKRGELGGAGPVALKVSHHANPDAVLIHLVAADVAAGELPGPAPADLDLAVFRASAIANDKVVGQPVLHAPALAMIAIIDARRPRVDPAVVADNPAPARALNADPGRGFDDGGESRKDA